MRDELKPTDAVKRFLKQAFKFPISFGGQHSIQLSYGRQVDVRKSIINRRSLPQRQPAVTGRSPHQKGLVSVVKLLAIAASALRSPCESLKPYG
jgi:hypothetical protein